MLTYTLLLLLALHEPMTPAPRPAVMVIPLGPVPSQTVTAVATSLRASFPVAVSVGHEVALPESARSHPRRRFSAAALLRYLANAGSPQHAKVVGVTAEDITIVRPPVPDWGVFGASFVPGRSAVLSTRRLQGHSNSRISPSIRAGRVAVHELGHALGLAHCTTPSCIMEDAHGSITSVDHTNGRFCPSCRQRIPTSFRPAA